MNEKIIELKVDKDITLSEYLKEVFSKKFYRKLKFYKANIYVNGSIREWYKEVNNGDILKIVYKEERVNEWPIYDKPLEVVYEDSHYLICYKEPNLLTIPTKAEPLSLYQQVIYYLKDNHISFLNRLDKETSGLVLVAKDTYSANLLAPVKENIKRKYLALVDGIMDGSGTISKRIKRSEESNRRVISDDGKEAITNYKVIKNYNDSTLVELILETGRTHQIRVHLSSLGHPIIGDTFYGNRESDIMYLESYYLAFINPYTKELIEKEVRHLL